MIIYIKIRILIFSSIGSFDNENGASVSPTEINPDSGLIKMGSPSNSWLEKSKKPKRLLSDSVLSMLILISYESPFNSVIWEMKFFKLYLDSSLIIVFLNSNDLSPTIMFSNLMGS